MPLLDHFHPPLDTIHGWSSFHAQWASTIVARLNGEWLPERYFAEPRVQWGRMAQIDVGSLDLTPDLPDADRSGGLATAVWAPPQATQRIAVDFADLDEVEVRVYRQEGGPKLVAAIELVSPANKDRPAHRDAFAIKCAAHLQKGVSVAIVDVVTELKADLHDCLMRLLGLECDAVQGDSGLYACAYRTTGRSDDWFLEIWREPLAVGESLPTLPMWLDQDLAVPLELEQTYATTLRSLRIRA